MCDHNQKNDTFPSFLHLMWSFLAIISLGLIKNCIFPSFLNLYVWSFLATISLGLILLKVIGWRCDQINVPCFGCKTEPCFGRKNEKDMIKRLLQAPNPQGITVVTGRKSAGKTSVIKAVLGECSQQHVFYGNWRQPRESSGDFFTGILRVLNQNRGLDNLSQALRSATQVIRKIKRRSANRAIIFIDEFCAIETTVVRVEFYFLFL